MKEKIIKFILTSIGVASFVYCITGEVDGIGRFALILFGLIFSFIGSFYNNKGE